jgi:acetyl esterase/lipase
MTMRRWANSLLIAATVVAAAAVARAQEPPAVNPADAERPPTPEEAELAAATFLAWPDRQYADDPDAPPQSQCLDLFTPAEKPASPLPVVVWIHGGGWQEGDKRGGLEWKPACFTHAGFLLASVNYRLAPAFLYPTFMADVARAVAWLHDHVAEYGGDPQRMVLMGHSAGAHIAALLATDRHWLADAGIAPSDPPQHSLLKGVVLLDGGGYDLERRARNSVDAENTLGLVFGRDHSQWAAASPVTHIAAGQGLPPFLLVHAGTQKATAVEARELARALRGANVPVEQVEAPDENHGTIQRVVGGPNDPTTVKVLEFMRKVTGAVAPATTPTAAPERKPKRHGPY